MRIMMHICCAPCAVFPVSQLLSQGKQVTAYFYNHNIHPYQEYRRRLDTVIHFCTEMSLDLINSEDYLLEEFLSRVAGKPDERCMYCYASRLEKAAETAAFRGFDVFTSSLLYSRYQQHEVIRDLGEKFARKFGVSFYYSDFRGGWQEGIRMSKSMGMYRQQYCGCIYSEKERYAGRRG